MKNYPVRATLLFASLFTLLLSLPVSAITPTQLASDFAYVDAKISPDGKHIAQIRIEDGRRKLVVVDSEGFEPVGRVDMGNRQEVGHFYWVNNKRLVIKVWVHQAWDDAPKYFGELYAVNYDGRRGKYIYGHRAGQKSTGTKVRKREAILGWADIINLLPDQENYILISSKPHSHSRGRRATVHRINVKSGRMSSIVAGAPAANSRFLTDKQGNVRYAVGVGPDSVRRVYEYFAEDYEWKVVESQQFSDDFQPLRLNHQGNKLFALDTDEKGLKGLYSIDLQSGQRTHVYTDNTVDIAGVVYSSGRDEVYAMRLEDGYPGYRTFNHQSDEAKVFNRLLELLKNYRVRITSRDKAAEKWLIHASNDVVAGDFYLYEKSADKLTLLFSAFDSVDRSQLSISEPVTFAATDGLDIHGYVTYPTKVAEDVKVPLVVLVHGGPQARDYWEFDSEVQLLASRGYAVLRVNFRGSYGYGRLFMEKGDKQWGNRIQKDVIDGTRWLIAGGRIDPDKVCIMGTSFGAYSAVQSSILAPDLYKCAVATAGVYDLNMLYTAGDMQQLVFGKAFLKDVIGFDETNLKGYSPLYNLEGLQAPVFIAHGGQDKRAPIAHAKKLKAALDARGKPYQWFIKPYANHGFREQAYREEYYEKVAAFLSEHLDAGE